MFWKRSTQQDRVLGVSIHRGEIRWSEVSFANKQEPMVMSHGSLDTGHPLWSYGEAIPRDLVRELAPLRAYRQLSIVCVIPEEHIHHAYLSIPREEGRKDKEVIEEYIESYCVEHDDLVVAETQWDWDYIRETQERVMVAVTLRKRNVTDGVKNLLRNLGFKNITFIPFSRTMMSLQSSASDHILLDIGKDISGLFAYIQNNVAHKKALENGRESILDIITRHVGDSDLSTRIYQRYGIKTNHRDGELLDQLHSHMGTIVEHIRDIIDEYATQTLPIIVTGDEAHMPGLMPFLQRSGYPAEHLDVWSRFSHPEDTLPIIDAHDRFRFAPALGAALDYIDRQ
jgi:hypothetical protein